MGNFRYVLNPHTGKYQKVLKDEYIKAIDDIANAISKEHEHDNKTELDKVTDGDHDVRIDNPHVVKVEQLDLASGTEASDVDDAVTKKHAQNTDTKLDNGQPNEVTSANLRNHLDSLSNPHQVKVEQLDLESGTVASDIDDVIDKKYYYVDRGDPSAYDFTKTNFTTDLQWHDLDLSSIVPDGGKLVHLKVRMSAFDLGGLQFRKKGNSNAINTATMKVQVSNIFYYEDFFVSCDSNRVIQYLASNISWTNLDVVIKGWFTNI